MSFTKVDKPLAVRDRPDDVVTFLSQLSYERKRHEGPKSAIYRPGRAPDWSKEDEETEGDDLTKNQLRTVQERTSDRNSRRVQSMTVIESKPKERRKTKAEVVVGDIDTRMVADDRPVTQLERPSVQIMELVEPAEEGEDPEEDDASSRRARARDRNREKRMEEEKALEEAERRIGDPESTEQGEQALEEAESEEEEEYFLSTRPMLKPTFISRKERGTIVERHKMEEDEIAYEEAKETRLKERKVESKNMVVAEIQREEEMKLKGIVDSEHNALPDDTDGVNEEEELEKWKIRELKRLKRDREEQEEIDREAAELEARRGMSDERIMELNRMDPKQQKKESQFRFLQKYYHKGAFFQGDEGDSVYSRNFTAPTGADKTVDRTLLPKVLQVKKFGIKGRTKYTHLTDQDTTGKETNPWAQTETTHVRPHKLTGVAPIKPSKRPKP